MQSYTRKTKAWHIPEGKMDLEGPPHPATGFQ